MDFNKITLFSMMRARIGYDTERQGVLAENIANADTPKYQPKDLKPLDFKHMAMTQSGRLQMRATQSSHITQTNVPVSMFKSGKMKQTYEKTPVKNSVSLEEQMSMVAQNQVDYQKTTNLYKKTADLFRIVTKNE